MVELMNKNTLRKIFKEKRAQISAEERARWAKESVARLAAHPRFLAADTLFLYASYGSELPTEQLAALARSMGKAVAYPKVEGKEMRFFKDGKLIGGYHGIPEPQGGEEVTPREGDLMLLPGLAFTKEGGRLGYGGGFYDRYLASCKVRPYLMGLCFPCQMAETLPREPHDITVQEIL